MIKIKIFSPFCSSNDCKHNYERINKSYLYDHYGKDYEFTINDDYTHAIIINVMMPILTISKQNVLGLAFEPYPLLNITSEFIEYAKIHIGKYYIGDCHDLPLPFLEHFGYMWYSSIQKNIQFKENVMSIVISSKKFAPGHLYRKKMVEYIIQYKLPIDIFGYGSNEYKYERIKGSFENNEPYESYMFSICIENYESNHYFSEKVISPYVLNCNPIYLGCRNIDSYLESIIHLNGNLKHDIEVIKMILRNPYLYYNCTYPFKDKFNLIHQLPQLFPK